MDIKISRIDAMQHRWFEMKNTTKSFALNYLPTEPKTFGYTTIDCMFTWYMDIDIMFLITYTSYHWPMLNKTVAEY